MSFNNINRRKKNIRSRQKKPANISTYRKKMTAKDSSELKRLSLVRALRNNSIEEVNMAIKSMSYNELIEVLVVLENIGVTTIPKVAISRYQRRRIPYKSPTMSSGIRKAYYMHECSIPVSVLRNAISSRLVEINENKSDLVAGRNELKSLWEDE